MDDMTANLLIEYGLINSKPIVEAETKRQVERRKIKDMADRLKGIDSDLDDLLSALLAIHHEEDLEAPVDANVLIEFGVINDQIIKDRENQRLELLFMTEALRKMDTKIENLMDAIQQLREEFRRSR